jgi:hypothetical protein
VNPSKCPFRVQEVGYFGHNVFHDGVNKVDPNKIRLVVEYPIPKTMKNLRGLLAMIGHYYKFSKNYGQIKTPHY